MTEVSAASILRISDEKTLQLIDLYYKEECLWNTHSEDYKNKEKRSLAAEKIATILDLPNFTARHVIMKFKNLRNSFSQELKKISNSVAAGAKDDEVYTPRVFWFKKLDSFIKPHLQGKTPTDVLILKRDVLPDNWMHGNAEQVLSPETTLTTKAHSESEEERSNDSCKKRKLYRNPKKPKAEVNEDKSVSQSLKDIQSHLHVLMSHNDDYHDSFGKYIASLLRSLPPQRALALQPKIVGLITDAGLESIEENSEEKMQTVECQSTYDMVMKFERDEPEEIL